MGLWVFEANQGDISKALHKGAGQSADTLSESNWGKPALWPSKSIYQAP